jgi:hypothetical protein
MAVEIIKGLYVRVLCAGAAEDSIDRISHKLRDILVETAQAPDSANFPLKSKARKFDGLHGGL